MSNSHRFLVSLVFSLSSVLCGSALAFEPLQDSDVILAEHFRCFSCQEGRWPSSIAELKGFQPHDADCADIFSNSSLAEADDIPDAHIRHVQWRDRYIVLYARQGVTFDQLPADGNFLTNRFAVSSLSCPLNTAGL